MNALINIRHQPLLIAKDADIKGIQGQLLAGCNFVKVGNVIVNMSDVLSIEFTDK